MNLNQTWFTPEGINDLLPAQAMHIEQLRRHWLDTMHLWGYEQVVPPLVEFVETLHSGPAQDLAHQTVQFIDQVSGRRLGVRGDMTPQVARIEAHRLQRQEITRLCYVGEVLLARPEAATQSRQPMQLGAEIYGASSLAADIEIISLLLSGLLEQGQNHILVSLGDMGLIQALLEPMQLTKLARESLFDIIDRKAPTDLQDWLSTYPQQPLHQQQLQALLRWQGDAESLMIKTQAMDLPQAAQSSLVRMQTLTQRLVTTYPQVVFHWDLADVRGHRYHTGMIFSVYQQSHRQLLARGGRYDGVGKRFGNARPATGFTLNLLAFLNLPWQVKPTASLLAPETSDPSLIQAIADARAQGWRVIQDFADTQAPQTSHKLVKVDQDWVIKEHLA